MRKVYVDVFVKDTKEGQRVPMALVWENGVRYEIDKVTDIRKAASLKAGGQGIRYRCRIHGKETNLWLEDSKWFVEAKNPVIDRESGE